MCTPSPLESGRCGLGTSTISNTQVVAPVASSIMYAALSRSIPFLIYFWRDSYASKLTGAVLFYKFYVAMPSAV